MAGGKGQYLELVATEVVGGDGGESSFRFLGMGSSVVLVVLLRWRMMSLMMMNMMCLFMEMVLSIG